MPKCASARREKSMLLDGIRLRLGGVASLLRSEFFLPDIIVPHGFSSGTAS